jgi:ribosome-associated translation inhibitor RaiA
MSSLQIEFHNAKPAKEVESRIRQELAELEKYYNRLTSCRVNVEAPEHERRGSLYEVRVDLGLPPDDARTWAELQGRAAQESVDHVEVKAKHKDPVMAVHAVFNLARRRVKDLVEVYHKA